MSLTKQIQVGRISVTILHDLPNEEQPIKRFFTYPSEAELNEVTERYNLAENLVASHNNLLIQVNGENILIDGGWGTRFDERPGRTLDALQELGLSANDIHKVVLTHAHVDHYAGLLTPNDSRDKAFPNAQYLMWENEWNHYTSDEYLNSIDVERREFMEKYFMPLGDHLTLINESSATIGEGIVAIESSGHTKHHLNIEVVSEGETLIAAIDNFIHPLHFNYLHWHWEFEFDAEQLKQARQAVIDRALERNAIIASYHFAFPGLGRITRQDDEIIWTTLP